MASLGFGNSDNSQKTITHAAEAPAKWRMPSIPIWLWDRFNA